MSHLKIYPITFKFLNFEIFFELFWSKSTKFQVAFHLDFLSLRLRSIRITIIIIANARFRPVFLQKFAVFLKVT